VSCAFVGVLIKLVTFALLHQVCYEVAFSDFFSKLSLNDSTKRKEKFLIQSVIKCHCILLRYFIETVI